MSRIRTIKPEFWTSEQIMECSTSARLLFIGLWNFSDDAGVHPSSMVRVKAEIFPGDDVQISKIQEWINELLDNDLIQEYSIDGKNYWIVTGWEKHQRIDKPTYKYPLPKSNNESKKKDKITVSRDKNSNIITTPLVDYSESIPGIVDDHSVTEWKGMDWNGLECNGKDQSQKLLSNLAIGRHNVESNDEEVCFPLIVDTLSGEVIETGTKKESVPRIEGKRPRIECVQIDPIVQIDPVQSCPKVVQKDKKDKNGQRSLNFELFWSAYPWKQKKKYSQEIWERKKLDTIIDIILEDLSQRTGWHSGSEFPPLPSTYLNGDLWNDEHKNRIREVKQPTKSLTEILEEKYKLEELQNKTDKTNEN